MIRKAHCYLMIKIATSFDSPLNPNIIKRRLRDSKRNNTHEMDNTFPRINSTLKKTNAMPNSVVTILYPETKLACRDEAGLGCHMQRRIRKRHQVEKRNNIPKIQSRSLTARPTPSSSVRTVTAKTIQNLRPERRVRPKSRLTVVCEDERTSRVCVA